jgi:hypothetical protein
MKSLVRVVRSASDAVFGALKTAVARPRHDLALRHRASGTLLTDGSGEAQPVRFQTADEALAFSRRFLDEPQEWEPVNLAELATQAA